MRASFTKAIQLLLLMGLAAHVYGCAQRQTPSTARRSDAQKSMSRKQKLALAEAAADRIIMRFHETLDFTSILNESFVREPRLRRRAVIIDESSFPADISLPLAERAYAAFMTYFHLFAEYRMIQDQQEVPPEVERSQLLSKNMNGEKTHLKSTAEVEEFIADMNQLSEMYRKHFSPEAFKSGLYKRNIAEEMERSKHESHDVPRIEDGNREFDISAQTPVYIVRREYFDYYFIEEQGVPRLFTINVLPNFKLF
ncbi:MAG: hypothetical protein WBP93_07885 [Pyrinomonadaceae bacterium]